MARGQGVRLRAHYQAAWPRTEPTRWVMFRPSIDPLLLEGTVCLWPKSMEVRTCRLVARAFLPTYFYLWSIYILDASRANNHDIISSRLSRSNTCSQPTYSTECAV